jgi:S1-C subfamily serine protease
MRLITHHKIVVILIWIFFLLCLPRSVKAQEIITELPQPMSMDDLDRIKERLVQAVFRVDVELITSEYEDLQMAQKMDGAAVAVTITRQILGERQHTDVILLTSMILVEKAAKIWVTFQDKQYPARVTQWSESGDLATLMVMDPAFYLAIKPISLGLSKANRKGTRVFTLRNLGTGLESVTIGELITRGDAPLYDYWASDINYPWGFPLVDESVQLRALIYRFAPTGNDSGFAADMDVIVKFILAGARREIHLAHIGRQPMETD